MTPSSPPSEGGETAAHTRIKVDPKQVRRQPPPRPAPVDEDTSQYFGPEHFPNDFDDEHRPLTRVELKTLFVRIAVGSMAILAFASFMTYLQGSFSDDEPAFTSPVTASTGIPQLPPIVSAIVAEFESSGSDLRAVDTRVSPPNVCTRTSYTVLGPTGDVGWREAIGVVTRAYTKFFGAAPRVVEASRSALFYKGSAPSEDAEQVVLSRSAQSISLVGGRTC